MTSKYDPVEISLDDLREVGRWAISWAEQVLPIYESRVKGDPRPRASIQGAREFIDGGPRTQQLRIQALDAYRAAVESTDPAASAAAHASCLIASLAYTHPIAAVHQTKHLLGPVAFAAIALEIVGGGASSIGEAEVAIAIEAASPSVREVVGRYPEVASGKKPVDRLMFALDRGLRVR